jgi:PDZ domain
MTPEMQAAAFAHPTETVTCPSCRAELVRGMRFCRLCGYRLGEGLAEYVETVRLNSLPTMPPAAPAATRGPSAFGQASAHAPAYAGQFKARRKRSRWLVWPLVGISLFAALGGGAAVISNLRGAGQRRVFTPPAPRSFLGGSDFTEVQGGGLLIEAVLPGSPAELAGLRDGDVLLRFDGRTLEDEGDITAALRATPVGKTVAVELLRDGEPQTVMLTTIARDSYNARAFVPPGGTGYWGISNYRRVAVPGTRFHGVRIGSVRANRPADIAGLKEGDIVVEFDGKPVRTTDGLESYIDHAAPGSTVLVRVVRGTAWIDIPVKMGRDD